MAKRNRKPKVTTMTNKEEIPKTAIPYLAPPSLIFDRMAYLKILHWVRKCPQEISGLGKVVRQPDGRFLVKDAILLPQKNTSGSTEIEAEDVARAMYLTKDIEGDLNFWWHSHVNMEVFWSKTDSDTITELSQHGYFVASVFNKKGEQRNAIRLSLPLGGDEANRINVFVDDISHEVVTYLPQEVFTQWDNDYEKNVKTVPEMMGLVGDPDWWQKHMTQSHQPTYDFFRGHRDPTVWDIEKGYMWELDTDNDGQDRWWKNILSKAGKCIGMKQETPPFAKVLKPVTPTIFPRTEREWDKLTTEEQDAIIEKQWMEQEENRTLLTPGMT